MLCLCSAGAQQQGLQTYSACFCLLIMQTNGKNSVPNAPKMAVLRYKIKRFSGRGLHPTPRRLRRFDSRAPRGSLVPPADLELATVLSKTTTMSNNTITATTTTHHHHHYYYHYCYYYYYYLLIPTTFNSIIISSK